MASQDSDGFALLARVLDKRNAAYIDRPSDIDFGTIKGGHALKCDNFPETLSSKDYTILRGTGARIGSRVLVVWMGDEPVVVDIIESPTEHDWPDT